MKVRIFTYKYATTYGGVVVLYKLASDLLKLGYIVNMFDYDYERVTNQFCNNYLDTYAEDDELVIYPEIVKGNPLHAKRVVRWILCELGKHCDKDIWKTWESSDFVYNYSSYSTSIENSKIRELFTMKLEDDFYNKNMVRSKTCFTVRKADKFHKPLIFIHPLDSIEITNLPHSELVILFNTCTYFYCYDPYTYLAMMAAACGCIPIVIPIQGIDKLSWLKTLYCANYLEEKGLSNMDGIAYGILDIEFAKKTINNARKQQDDMADYGFETVKRFGKDMETIKDSSLVYWNVGKIYGNSLVILGDSHSQIYHKCDSIKKFFNNTIIHYTDYENEQRSGNFTPFLMNSVAQRGEIMLKTWMDKIRNTNCKFIMFVFGEPDVRIHFNKQINGLNRTIDEVIETLCVQYILKLLEIVPTDIKIIIRYLLPQREFSMFGEYVPHGSLSDRIIWTNKMNIFLKKTCSKYNILFFDNISSNLLTKSNGELKDEYCYLGTHYNEHCVQYLNDEIEYFCKSAKIERTISIGTITGIAPWVRQE